ncbi:mismatch repair ATPase MSH6 [Scheffersomyces xylosifermentans]|uniref:mismatch repair ATPase MSH6 n=1 Tax=Scheffersomyces xylosifermentans TaxID=1304137 RepID=UPI00315CFE99
MSQKIRKPSTPLKSSASGSGVKNSGGTSCGKLKQQSLMAFFKPASAKPASETKSEKPSDQPASSSPLKAKSEKSVKEEKQKQQQKQKPSSKVSKKTTNEEDFLESESPSDKENDQLMDAVNDTNELETDTPLSSETGTTPSRTQKPRNASIPKSSPPPEARREKQNSSKKGDTKPLHERNTNLDSSPLVKRRSASRSVSYAETDSEDEDEQVMSSSRKRRKVVDSEDDEDEDDFKPVEDDDDDDDMSDFIVEDDKEESEIEVDDDDDADVVGDDEDEIRHKPSKKSKSSNKSTPKKESSSSTSNNALGNKFKAGSAYTATPSVSKTKPITSSKSPPKKNFAKENEERYHWLVEIRDGEKRTIDHPEYDPRTLHVPQSAWSKFTAFEKQYWEIKSKMWNTVVFFKKGKFYELYENDAVIANTEFDLKIAGGGRANMKLAGIPEMSFEYWAKEFISHGYKVAKVNQVETLLAKEMRGGSTKEEKIIKRELAGVLTGGTLTDLNMINDDMAVYCLSIREEILDDGSKVFGVAFVDTATSELSFIEFTDDAECTKLDTLITQVKPKEILCEKNNLCSIAVKILKFNAQGHQIWNDLNPITEFWDYDTTLEHLVKAKYYEAEDLDDYSNFPPTLVDFKDNHKVAFSAFGGLLYYLNSLKLDNSIMTLGHVSEYNISKQANTHMLLDGITLNNLEILNNSFDGGDRGTLFKLINRASTPFGKRALKNWVLHPLMKINDINERYDSIDYLMNDGLELRTILEQGLGSLPDLERLLARIHSKALKFKDFLKVIESFESISNLVNQLTDFTAEKSGALFKYLSSFPEELQSIVKEWEDAFDREEAKKDVIVPSQGVDSEFDDSQEKMKNLEGQLEQHLKDYKKTFKSHEIVYRDSGKEIFLIEFPNKLVKQVPNDWQQMGSTSKVKRYWSPEVKQIVRELMEQRELHKMVCETLKGRMYDRFDAHYTTWLQTTRAIANIDCLLALTRTSETIGYPSCRPEFIESEKGHIEFKDLRHPCFLASREFIPNDVCLGGSEPNFGLLTGANAAGKSTLMRTTALAVILSQIGCYLPSSYAKLSPVDKIMTRLGANDNIMQGKSTFFVELSETKKILSNATPKSLVILDELGRGGSSSDGYAIAESTLYHLSTHVQSLGFFATHYGTLGLSFQSHPQIKPLRMAIVIDNHSRNITFLYKLEEGTAPGSFGMNVASMCGISDNIVDKAEVAAKQYEQTSKLKKTNDAGTLGLGLQSDFSWFSQDKTKALAEDILKYDEEVKQGALSNIFKMIDNL